jgi:hypothetical protein
VTDDEEDDYEIDLSYDPDLDEPPCLCTACGVNDVDARNGYDTCAECLAKR